MAELSIRTLARGEMSGIRTRDQLVIRDAETWRRVWSEHTADMSPPPPSPAVDLDREQIVAVFDGERPSSGYAVEIVSARVRPGEAGAPPEIVVTVRRREPDPGAAVLDVLTTPYHIAAIPIVEGARVTFAAEPPGSP